MRSYVCLLAADAKRYKVPWHFPGSFWVWSSHQCLRPGTDRFVVAHGNRSTYKIPITIQRDLMDGVRTVDLTISAAPPEFENARRYLLRFHLTDITRTPTAPAPPQQSPPKPTLAEEPLQDLVKLERLMQLHAQLKELRGFRCPDPSYFSIDAASMKARV